MTIGVWDQNHTLVTHNEFDSDDILTPSRVTTPDFLSVDVYEQHATHVGGTLVGRGNDLNAKGMAPKASLRSYNWIDDATEVLNEASSNALLISNHSYGIPIFFNGTQQLNASQIGTYDSDALIWDDIAYNNPYYLHVVSAGNEGMAQYSGGTGVGFDKLTREKNSKNNLVVANASNPVVSATGELTSLSINPSSSQGPSDDGRIKPDIAGDGTDVYSSYSSGNSAYGFLTGTSMSSPNVAGSLILLQQYYNMVNASYMKSATLKGLVCHTADDDTAKIGPDPIYGWGLLNAKSAIETIQEANNGTALIEELTLQDGQTYSSSFSSTGSGPLSVSICWTDLPGIDQSGQTNSTTPAIVNDLDIILRDPDGFVIHFPWKLLAFNVNAPAITGINNVDTVERIDLDMPSVGTYIIEVSHKGTLINMSQDFSLVVTGKDLTLSTPNIASDNNNLLIWPNPAKDIINYSFKSNSLEKIKISLIDIQGREIFTKNNIENNQNNITGSIDLSKYSKGMYFLNIKQGNLTTNKKIVIE